MSTLKDQAETFVELRECLVAASHELFDAYGMKTQYSPGGAIDPWSDAVMAVIGYAAEGLRGAVVLITAPHVVEQLRPEVLRLGSDVGSDLALRDVLGEFANMLIGRVKNKLLARGLAPLLATPTTFSGSEIQLPVPRSGMSAWHRFSSEAGEIYVRLDATLDANFILPPRQEHVVPPLAEGEMVMF